MIVGLDSVGGAGADRIYASGKGNHSVTYIAYQSIADSTPDNPDVISNLGGQDWIYLYAIDADTTQEGDQAFEIEGIPCVMNKAHEIYLYGMQVDWQDGLNNRGFTFSNPNASSTCGCGTSFAV